MGLLQNESFAAVLFYRNYVFFSTYRIKKSGNFCIPGIAKLAMSILIAFCG